MPPTLEDIQTIVRLQLGLKEIPAPQTRLIEELGAESADIVNLIAALEDKYQIFIAEDKLITINTVANLHSLVKSHLGQL